MFLQLLEGLEFPFDPVIIFPVDVVFIKLSFDGTIHLYVLVNICPICQLLSLVEGSPRNHGRDLRLVEGESLLLLNLVQSIGRHFVTFLRFIALHCLLA